MGERRIREDDDEDMLDWDAPAPAASAENAPDEEDDELLDWDSPAPDAGPSMQVGDIQMGGAPEAPQQAPEDDEHSYMDGLLSYGDGLLGHWGGEAAKLATRGADYLSPEGMSGMAEGDPERAEHIVDRAAQQHPYANGAGQATLGIGGAAVAGPGILAQAAMGGAIAGGSEYGDSHSPLMAGGKALIGAGVSGLAAGVGAGAARLTGKPVPQGPEILPGARPGQLPYARGTDTSAMATQVGPNPLNDAARSEMGQYGDQLVNMAKMLANRSPTVRALRAGGQLVDRLSQPTVANETARGAAIYGTEAAGELLGSVYRDLKGRVSSMFGGDDPDRAPAGKKVVDWALKSVLTSPDAGLSQPDAAALNQKMMSGDAQGTASLLYTLSQKNPAFAAMYERALKRANGDNE
jgi:hypothetical protein